MIDTKINKRGRPKQFDRAKALDDAKTVFCRFGYDKTSLSQLTEAMAIRPPSLYSAFGDKEKLFIEVLDTYHKPYREHLKRIFHVDEQVETAIAEFLNFNKELHTQPNPQGCLIVNSTILFDDNAAHISEKLRALHQFNENTIENFLKEKISKGQLSKGCDPRAIALFVNAQIQAAALIARRKNSQEEVKLFLDKALQSIFLLLNI